MANGDLLMFQQIQAGLLSIVLPKSFWTEVLSLDHKNPLPGHFGVTKTYHKVLNHFFWPCIKKRCLNFCRSSYLSTGRKIERVSCASSTIRAFEESFSRVLI